MIRKLWLELRWVFAVLVCTLIALTAEYTWAFQQASIMAYNDQSGIGMVLAPGGNTATEVADFMKEHPRGKVLSLQTAPETYFVGVDGIGRIVMPFLIVALCAGGILSERSSGTASFSLSLPVSRASWLWSRAAAVLVLAGTAASLSCIVAFGLAKWMGVEYGAGWLVTEPFLLTLGAAPWVGLVFLIQSLLSGRFDAASESIVTAALSAFLVILVEVFLSSSALRGFGSPYSALLDAADSSVHPAVWNPFWASGLLGFTCMLLSIRRFQRMDF